MCSLPVMAPVSGAPAATPGATDVCSGAFDDDDNGTDDAARPLGVSPRRAPSDAPVAALRRGAAAVLGPKARLKAGWVAGERDVPNADAVLEGPATAALLAPRLLALGRGPKEPGKPADLAPNPASVLLGLAFTPSDVGDVGAEAVLSGALGGNRSAPGARSGRVGSAESRVRAAPGAGGRSLSREADTLVGRRPGLPKPGPAVASPSDAGGDGGLLDAWLSDGCVDGSKLPPLEGGSDDGDTRCPSSPGVDTSEARCPSAAIASCTENTVAHSLQRILAVGLSASLSSVMRYLVSHLGQWNLIVHTL